MGEEKNKIGIGVVGLGVISYQHAQSILDTENAELVAACSRSEKNRSEFLNEFDVQMYAEYEKMLEREDLHAVAICTPSGTHLEYGVKAAEAGKHLIVEKPIDVIVERGQKLIDSCENNGVKLAVIYQNRFSDSVLKLKHTVESGKIGKPVMARGTVKWYRTEEYFLDSGWRGTLDLDGGGALINQSIHTVDLLQWILGDIESVTGMKATLTHPDIEAEDNLVASLQFSNGALGVFEASTSITPPQRRTIEINGSEGTVLLEGDEFSLYRNGKVVKEQPPENEEDFLTQQFRQIVGAILNNKQPPVSGPEALKSLAIVEAIYESCKQGTTIKPSSYLSKG